MSLARKGRLITLIGLGLLAAVYVRALAFTPVERVQGPAQKIYYLHVPAAIWAEMAMFLVGLAGIFYLFLKDAPARPGTWPSRSEEHTSELQSHHDLVCRLLLEKKKKI